MAKTVHEAAASLLPSSPPPPQICYGVPAAASAGFQGDPFSYREPPAGYILLPVYSRPSWRRPRCRCRCCGSLLSSSTLLSAVFLLALLLSAAFFLWPSDPDLQVARLRLDRLSVVPPPFGALSVSLGVDLRVRNPDFFALDYSFINVSIAYRGQWLGSVSTDGEGHIRARGVSYVETELRLDGIQLLNDAFYLIEDLARGSLPLETVTEIDGRLRFFFFDVPVKGRISCAVTVNPGTQKISHQDCYPA